ncbi:related to NMD2-Nonsense-mediated mRNA decay protein 2 [Serendipita indica DSM 11827]|uniref:Related to NMD2-Nonsense-mediated mRNA decay protein 2 n=1 Tax=Serendipita indica (strain DSM 11827) TaxID=1109443 RepID=G4T4U1_SERID|nr:related to NMD2-Nonsense-mediated mRNA decay protein 2 [Serendipita indica DSM 11827]
MDVARETKDDEEAAKRARRRSLRELNLSSEAPRSKGALDASLKRHTALIRRAKLSIGMENRDQILKDIETLTLEKYVEEIAASLVEGLARCKTDKDIWSATEIISAVHRRLGSTFTPKFVNMLHQSLAPPPKNVVPPASTVNSELQEKEVAARISRQRPVLRVCSELALVGIIGPNTSETKSGGEWIMKAMKDLLSHDMSLSSIPLLITFLKGYGRPYLGPTPGSQDTVPEGEDLSELLNQPMPHLPAAASKADTIGLSTGERIRSDEVEMGRSSQFEDEEDRKFYEDLMDLKDWVPRSFLNVPEEDAASSAATDAEGENADIGRLTDLGGEADEDSVYEAPTSRSPSPVTEVDASVAPGPSQALTVILGKLPDATSRDSIDQAATEFMFVNSKAARKRLVKFLMSSPKQRTDLIPYYGRLVATVSKYAPDLSKELLEALEDEFRYLQRKKKVVKELASMRTKNITWFSVLTKFHLVPPHVILHIFRVFLDDLSGTNVDSLATLLEGCGRFLLRGSDTGKKTAEMLDLMKRKQSLQKFDQRQILLLENAYYQCNPPERGPIEHKQRSTIELFIRHLLCDVLTRKSLDNVLKLLRKLNWDDTETERVLFKMFTKPWKVSFSTITLMAILAYDLQRYHSKFCVDVVDQVMENIRLGMEQNIYKNNQKRVATVKYLGELYIYRLVNSRVIFDTLWSLVTFGHSKLASSLTTDH